MDSMQYTDESYFKCFMSNLESLWRDSSYTDVILKVEDMSIKCHKAVLCAGSSYFSTMFSSGLEEEKKTEVELSGIDAASTLSLVGFVYTGRIEVTIDNAQALIQTSHLLQFNSIKDTCEEFMTSHVQPNNCIGFFKFAKLYDLERLKGKARSCMLERFTEVIKSPEFTEMAQDDLIEYISDDKVDIPNENIVFEGVLTWINASLRERKRLVPAIAQHVRFPFCTASYLCQVVSKNALMEIPECQVLLQEANSYHMMFGHETSFISQRTAPRHSFGLKKHLLIFGGYVNDEDALNEYVWSVKEGDSSWEVFSKLPSSINKDHSACVVPGGIFVTGGWTEGEACGDCWLFEMMGKRWKRLPSLAVSRHDHSSLLLDNAVYVLGGWKGETVLDSVEKFDLKQHKWMSVCSMLRPVQCPPLAAFRSCIYAFGGLDEDGKPLQLTQEYDTVYNIWCMRTKMPHSCDGVATVSLGDSIFVFGGSNRICFSYQPLSDTWTTLASPELIHGWSPAVVWGNKILICGGSLGKLNNSSEIEEYDPKSNTWTRWGMKMPKALWLHHAFNIALFPEN